MILAGVERHNELALVGESAEGGDALDVGGGDLQESSRPAVGALAELLQRAGLIRGGGCQAVEEHGRALDVKDVTPASAVGPDLGTRHRRRRAAGAGHRPAVWRTRSTTAPSRRLRSGWRS